MAKDKDTAKKTFSKLIEALGIQGDFEITENSEGYDIVLTTDDSGIVIGRHGDTLEGLQIISSLAISKALGEFKRVSIEVGDYKKNREEYLRNLAMDTKDKVMSEGKEISLPDLKSWERRIIHLILQDDKEVISESLGEGRDRVLVIRPR